MLMYANVKQIRVPVVWGQSGERKLEDVKDDLCGEALKVPMGTYRWMQMCTHPWGLFLLT